jgi:voltage-gated potassium channel
MSLRSFEELPRRDRRRMLFRALAQSALTSGAMLLLYFLLPLDEQFSGWTAAALGLGVAAVGGLVAWQTRSIINSDYPRLRAFQALSSSAPLFLLLFATTYFLLDRSQDSAFNTPMTRLDSLYFTVTVFATVGFGDIVATSQTARLLVTIQMIGDMILIGLVLKVLVNAVQVGLSRRPRQP